MRADRRLYLCHGGSKLQGSVEQRLGELSLDYPIPIWKHVRYSLIIYSLTLSTLVKQILKVNNNKCLLNLLDTIRAGRATCSVWDG